MHDLPESGRLIKTLKSVRSRLYVRAIFTSSFLAVFVGMIVAAVIRMSPWGVQAHGYVYLFTFSIVFLGALSRQLILIPNFFTIARQLDNHFSLNERLSSAVEISASDNKSRMGCLLMADAIKHVEMIDTASLVPLKPSRLMTGVLLALSAVLFYAVVPLRNPENVAQVEITDEFAGAIDFKDLADTIRHVAEDLAETAIKDQDEYLAVVAQSLDSFADQVESGVLTPQGFRQALGYFSEHIEHASGPTSEHLLALESLTDLDFSAAFQQSASHQVTDAELPQDPVLPVDSPLQPAIASRPSEGRGINTKTDNLEASQQIELDANAQESARPLPLAEVGLGTKHYMDADPEMLARLEERRQQMLLDNADASGAVPVGASQQSTPGAGEIGGEGAGDSVDAAVTAEVEFEFETDSLELPSSLSHEGQRITVQASPDTELTETDHGTNFTIDQWRTAEESALNPASISVRQRNAVKQYFLPLPVEQ